MTFRMTAALPALLASALAVALAGPAAAFDAADLKRLLSSGHCPGCDLSGAQIVDEDLRKAYLPGADLAGANLLVTNLSGADLSGANLEGADLTQAVLLGTILDGANLKNATVQDADFTGASLSGTDIAGTAMNTATGADVSRVKGAAAQATPPAPAPTPPPAPPPPAPKLSAIQPQMKPQRIGSVALMATPFCPSGTFEADGSTLAIQEHSALFSLYGLAYGGDGRINFKLPDLRGEVPAKGLRYCIVSGGGTFPSRS